MKFICGNCQGIIHEKSSSRHYESWSVCPECGASTLHADSFGENPRVLSVATPEQKSIEGADTSAEGALEQGEAAAEESAEDADVAAQASGEWVDTEEKQEAATNRKRGRRRK